MHGPSPQMIQINTYLNGEFNVFEWVLNGLSRRKLFISRNIPKPASNLGTYI